MTIACQSNARKHWVSFKFCDMRVYVYTYVCVRVAIRCVSDWLQRTCSVYVSCDAAANVLPSSCCCTATCVYKYNVDLHCISTIQWSNVCRYNCCHLDPSNEPSNAGTCWGSITILNTPRLDPFLAIILLVTIHPNTICWFNTVVYMVHKYHGVRQPATKILLSSCQAASTAENHQLNTVRHRPVG